MKKGKMGRIDISALNVPPERHEYDTALFFAKRGKGVWYSGGIRAARPRAANVVGQELEAEAEEVGVVD